MKALVEVEPGKNLAGAGGVHSWKEWAELFSKIKGVTCTYEDLPNGEMDKVIPGGLGAELEDMFRYMDDFGYFGGDKTVIYPSEVSSSGALSNMATNQCHSLKSKSPFRRSRSILRKRISPLF